MSEEDVGAWENGTKDSAVNMARWRGTGGTDEVQRLGLPSVVASFDLAAGGKQRTSFREINEVCLRVSLPATTYTRLRHRQAGAEVVIR